MASLTAATMLAACVTTQAGRIGADDGSDSCRAQVVALDSTGDFYGESIIRGAAVGAASGALLGGLLAAASGRGRDVLAGAAIGAVAGGVIGGAGGYFASRQQQNTDQAALNRAIGADLLTENASLDRTQIAFNQVMDCRVTNAQRIRENLRAGRLTRPQAEAMMADVRTRTQRDIQIAQTINTSIGRRGTEFDTAIENVAPGVKDQVLAGARIGNPVPVRARAPVALKLRPDAGAPEVAQVSAQQAVTIRPASNGFALVETSSGLRGYAPIGAFPEARGLGSRPVVPAVANEGDVRSLAASNVARRDNFAQSVGNAERLAAGQGFELAS